MFVLFFKKQRSGITCQLRYQVKSAYRGRRANLPCVQRSRISRKENTMAHDAPQASGPTKLVIRNIGLMLSGALEKPILDADTIVAENGKITGIGRLKDLDIAGATTVIDAHGTTVAPGLIDSHVHPVAGDWTPRQNQINWIDSYLHGGVTTMISAGEVHMPGRPRSW
jgi:enamidase